MYCQIVWQARMKAMRVTGFVDLYSMNLTLIWRRSDVCFQNLSGTRCKYVTQFSQNIYFIYNCTCWRTLCNLSTRTEYFRRDKKCKVILISKVIIIPQNIAHMYNTHHHHHGIYKLIYSYIHIFITKCTCSRNQPVANMFWTRSW